MQNPYVQALEFLVDAGVTTALMDEPNNRFREISAPVILSDSEESQKPQRDYSSATPPQNDKNINALKMYADIITEAEKLASACETLNDLKSAIQNFDGLSLKKTATHIVFADGNPESKIMVIGDTPHTADDRNGKPFTDVDGQLLDKIFACIHHDRTNLYLTNILNWRPPGNRTPTPEEIALSAPFLKRHIELINPDMIVCLGGVPAQILLGSKESISRLRGKFHDYNDTTKLVATYHPSSLLKTPLQKKKVWEDMVMIQEHLDA